MGNLLLENLKKAAKVVFNEETQLQVLEIAEDCQNKGMDANSTAILMDNAITEKIMCYYQEVKTEIDIDMFKFMMFQEHTKGLIGISKLEDNKNCDIKIG